MQILRINPAFESEPDSFDRGHRLEEAACRHWLSSTLDVAGPSRDIGFEVVVMDRLRLERTATASQSGLLQFSVSV